MTSMCSPKLNITKVGARPELVTQVVPGPTTFHADTMVMQLLKEGYIGDLQSMDLHVSTGMMDREAPFHWRMNRDFSGANIMTMGIWYECVSRWVGPARAVMARTRVATPYRVDPERGERRSVDVPDHVEVLADLANGAIARMHWSGVTGFMPGPEVWLYGSEGTLRIELLERDNLRLSGARRGDKAMAVIDIPEGTQTDKQFRLRGKGIKGLRSSFPGDLYCHITVETPVKLTEHQRKLLKELDESLKKGGQKHMPNEGSWADKLKNLFS